jgi:hypothetical protein
LDVSNAQFFSDQKEAPLHSGHTTPQGGLSTFAMLTFEADLATNRLSMQAHCWEQRRGQDYGVVSCLCREDILLQWTPSVVMTVQCPSPWADCRVALALWGPCVVSEIEPPAKWARKPSNGWYQGCELSSDDDDDDDL